MSLYLAARYGRRAELCRYKHLLEALGHVVTSRWLDHGEYDAIDKSMTPQQMAYFAFIDIEDLEAADTFIVFTEADTSTYSRGGRHIETGYALAMCKRIIVIGPLENIFYALPHLTHYASWTDYLACEEAIHGHV